MFITFQVVSLVDQSCLDVYKADLSGEFSTFGCHGMGGNQFFAFAENGQIISAEDSCVGVSKKRKIMTLVECSDHDRSQLWKYDESVSSEFQNDKQGSFKIRYLDGKLKMFVAILYRTSGFHMQKLDFASPTICLKLS